MLKLAVLYFYWCMMFGVKINQIVNQIVNQKYGSKSICGLL